MKKLLLLLLISFSLSSCGIAQELPPTDVRDLDLTVMYVENGTAGLYNPLYGKTFKGAAGTLTQENVEKQYHFIITVIDCDNCKVINVTIDDYSITPAQADKDIKKMLRDNQSIQNRKSD
ncbi:hypothetical protein SAMN04487764_1497 [Gillisia sp. Hel1_33_143]|uniref:hypothetical protein n=1 Tax=Gillisia sp. Hel1_33_143 TaxID=1336796 RepID=UPI00087CAC58|nr:hypothetical protein [Gillisia sp. Hel1_33_143]SDS11835.1 hypothetical protein SAMN04487764_1497 [Gillisia sp. Hel1_33_143]